MNGAALFFGATAATSGDNVVVMTPTGPPATLALSNLAGFWAVSIRGGVGRSYELQATDDLTSNLWVPLARIILTQSPRIYIDGDSVGKTERFYRCVLVE